MTDAANPAAAQITVAALKKAVKQRLLRTAIIKDDKAWDALYGELRNAYTRAWKNASKEALAAALDRMRELDPGKFGKREAAVVMSTLESRLGGAAVAGLLTGPVLKLSDALFRLGAKEVGDSLGKKLGVDIVFGKPDLDALEQIGRGNLFWIQQHWNDHSRKAFDESLKTMFSDGLTRQQLAQTLADKMGGVVSASTRYWELTADHAAVKVREMGRVTGYERAGVQHVQVRANLDESTTPFCRSVHGRVIAVSQLKQQREAYISAIGRQDKAAAKSAWKMYSPVVDMSGKATSGLPKDIGSPPYHFRCRTITVAYFPTGASAPALPASSNAVAESGPLDGWKRKAYDRQPLTRKETEALVARSKSALWSSAASLKTHYNKHGKNLYGSVDTYNQAAIDLIRRGNRDVFLSVRRGRLKAIFARQYKSKGKKKWVFTSVDVKANRMETHHKRRSLLTKEDEVPVVKQPGKGIMKWLS